MYTCMAPTKATTIDRFQPISMPKIGRLLPNFSQIPRYLEKLIPQQYKDFKEGYNMSIPMLELLADMYKADIKISGIDEGLEFDFKKENPDLEMRAITLDQEMKINFAFTMGIRIGNTKHKDLYKQGADFYDKFVNGIKNEGN